MKLTYWTAEALNEDPSYNIQARTKKAAKAIVAERGQNNYGPITKVVLEYKDGFDLLDACLTERGITLQVSR